MRKIRPELIDELLKDYTKPEDVIGDDGLLKQLTKAIVEQALESELTHQLGYEKHTRAENPTGNSRNGKSSKTLKTDHGDIWRKSTVLKSPLSSFQQSLMGLSLK